MGVAALKLVGIINKSGHGHKIFHVFCEQTVQYPPSRNPRYATGTNHAVANLCVVLLIIQRITVCNYWIPSTESCK